MLGSGEREKLFIWYRENMPGDINETKKDASLIQLRWTVEKKIEENQGMLALEVGKTFRQVYLHSD